MQKVTEKYVANMEAADPLSHETFTITQRTWHVSLHFTKHGMTKPSRHYSLGVLHSSRVKH